MRAVPWWHDPHTSSTAELLRATVLTPRLDREFDRWGDPATPDEELVELQQYDVATWEVDWVKIVPRAKRWKLLGGAK